MRKGVILGVVVCALLVSLVSVGFEVVVASGMPPLYAYRVDLGNVTVQRVIALSGSEVVIIGSAGGASSITVYRLVSPMLPPEIVMTYPLTGRVTAVATNGYPVRRIAVGTDRGELLVFAVVGGRLFKLLDYVGGADFHIEKLLVLTTPDGKNYKVVALVSEKGSLGGVCLSCEVYVFDPGVKSVFRIGSNVGNATVSSLGDVYPQLVAVPLVVSAGSFYYDASHLFVAWLPVRDLVHLLLNVTYIGIKEKELPGSKAGVYVVAYNRSTGEKYIYGVNADGRGIADVIVPRGFDVNVTVYDISGRSYELSLNLSKIPVYVSVIEERLQLKAPPVTTPMSRIYGEPEFTKYVVGVLDVSGAPGTYKLLRVIDWKLPRGTSGMSVVMHRGWYVLGYTDPSKGALYLLRLSTSLSLLNGTLRDYVGRNNALFDMITLPSSDYVVVAFSGGLVKAYEWIGNRYVFASEYVLPDSPIKLKPLTMRGNYYYVFIKDGMQVIRLVGASQFPLLRLDHLLAFGGGAVWGDALGSLSFAVLGEAHDLLVVCGLSNALIGNEPINVNNYMLPKMVIHVMAPKGEELVNGKVVLTYPGGMMTFELGKNRTVVVPNVFPGITYDISVTTGNSHIRNASLEVPVTSFKDVYVNVTLPYRVFNVSLTLVDSVTHKVITGGNFTIYVDGKPIGTMDGHTNITLIYGVHSLSIVPNGVWAGIYRQKNLVVNANRSLSLWVDLLRLNHGVDVVFLDRLTGKAPMVPLVVYVNGSVAQILKPGEEEMKAYLVAGNYTFLVEPAGQYGNVYYNATLHVNLNKDYKGMVQLVRKKYLVNITVRDVTTGHLLGRFELLVNGSVRLANITDRANITLPYGVYKFELRPMVHYRRIYVSSKPVVVKVVNETVVRFNVQRMFYNLEVDVFNDIGKPIENAEVIVTNLDLGSTLSMLYTDESGMATTSLFFGNYRVTVKADGYYSVAKTFVLDGKKVIHVTLYPKPLTLLKRYMYVFIVVGLAGIITVLVLKIKAKLAGRLVRSSEEVF